MSISDKFSFSYLHPQSCSNGVVVYEVSEVTTLHRFLEDLVAAKGLGSYGFLRIDRFSVEYDQDVLSDVPEEVVAMLDKPLTTVTSVINSPRRDWILEVAAE